MNKDQFPGNSNKTRNVPEVKKIIKGKVVRRKKSLKERFVEAFTGDDTRSVLDYIFYDVLIPSAKDLIFDMVKSGLEMKLFGDKRGRFNTPRDRGGRSYTNYNAYYRSDNDHYYNRDRDRRDISKANRARHDFSEIILNTREDAENILSSLIDLIIDYGVASVADLYDMVGMDSDYTDQKYGWTELRDSRVSRVREGYLINLPRPRPID